METKMKSLKITIIGEGSQTGEQTQQSINTKKMFCFVCWDTIAGENAKLTFKAFSELLRHLQICSSEELPGSARTDLGLCLECNKITGEALKQFQNLEKIQMELYHNLDGIRKRILKRSNASSTCSSGNGSVIRLRKRFSAECINILSRIRQPSVTIERMDLPLTLSKYNLSLARCKDTTFVKTQPTCPKTMVEIESDYYSHCSLPSPPVQDDSDGDDHNINTSLTNVTFPENYGTNSATQSTVPKRKEYKNTAKAAEKNENSNRMNRDLCSGIFGDIVDRLKEVERQQVTEDSVRSCGKKPETVTKKHQKTHKCRFCSKSFPSHYRMRRHIKFIHLMEPKHKCDQCKKSFYTEELLQSHRNLAHPEIIHQIGAAEEVRYKCGACDKSFVSIGGRLDHYKSKHLEIRFSCTFPECSKSYVNQRRLNLHKQFKHPHWKPPQN